MSQICTASSKRDAPHGYVNNAGVAQLYMWDLILPFVILKLLRLFLKTLKNTKLLILIPKKAFLLSALSNCCYKDGVRLLDRYNKWDKSVDRSSTLTYCGCEDVARLLDSLESIKKN